MKEESSALAEKIIASDIKIPIENGAIFEFEGKTYTVQLSSATHFIKRNKNNGKFTNFLNIFLNQWLKLTYYFAKNNMLILIEEKNNIQYDTSRNVNLDKDIQHDTSRNVNLDKEIKNMINDGWIEIVFKYIEEGYELKEEDCIKLVGKIWDTKYEYQQKIIEDIFLKKKLDVKYQAMFFFLLHIHSPQKNFEKEMLKKSKDDEFTQYVKYYWLAYLQKCVIESEKSPFISSIYLNIHWRKTLIEYPTVVLKNITTKELMDIQSKLNKIKEKQFVQSSNNILDMLETIQKNSYALLENEFIKNIDFIKNGEFKNNQNPFFIRQIIPNKNDLSEETQEMLNDLILLCKNLIQQNLKEEELFQLQNISEKRIPEIIQKYLSIDREYRLELKNSSGQTAEEMMNDSLSQLRENLENNIKETNIYNELNFHFSGFNVRY